MMKTEHKIYFEDSKKLDRIESGSVDLIVTSPPYPMIEMWDKIFSDQNIEIRKALNQKDGPSAFERMHEVLDKTWNEVHRVLKPGGIAAINIGDATRTINGRFALYTNHSRIQSYMQKIGFSALPLILWRKQTNAPNKFMGSGMMPPGAYVTLEHEYILTLRKGDKRAFDSDDDKQIRKESSFFWEERNVWFSDVWTDLKGTSQNLFDPKTRGRSAAFPFEVPYRLITMFSVKGDTILDPFLGIGTTLYAAMAGCRNSIGYEIDTNLEDAIASGTNGIIQYANQRIHQRLKDHCTFVENHFKRKGRFKYYNKNYLFPVVTGQETNLLLNDLENLIQKSTTHFEVSYSTKPQEKFVGYWEGYVMNESDKEKLKQRKRPQKSRL